MAKKLKTTANLQTLIAELTAGSYAKETATTLLQRYNVNFSNEEIEQELKNKHSIYRQLLHLPAQVIKNQHIVNDIIANKDYLEERLSNITFAATAARTAHPELLEPLSEMRQKEYSSLQQANKNCVLEAIELAMEHDDARNELYDDLFDDIMSWYTLCANTADSIGKKLRDNGFELPEHFETILLKHLERPGLNEISQQDIQKYGVNQTLNWTEKALVLALKEVKDHG